jgi:hypothetical protein
VQSDQLALIGQEAVHQRLMRAGVESGDDASGPTGVLLADVLAGIGREGALAQSPANLLGLGAASDG